MSPAVKVACVVIGLTISAFVVITARLRQQQALRQQSRQVPGMDLFGIDIDAAFGEIIRINFRADTPEYDRGEQ